MANSERVHLKDYDEIDRLVDFDTLALRDYAAAVSHEAFHLRVRIATAQALREHHLRGTPPGMEDKCQCVGCEMGRALDKEGPE